MKRSLRCTLALGAVITLTAGCADSDSVSATRTTWSPPSVREQPPNLGADPYMIYLQRLGDTTRIALTPGSSPVWSRDGSRIAFYSKRGGNYDLYVVNREGTVLTQLTRDGLAHGSVWSPDGSRIAWSSDRALKVMNIDGTNQITLAQPSSPSGGVGMAAWSPDGLKLAYVVAEEGKIHVVNADGSRDVTLPFSGAAPKAIAQPPAWSPDGTRIAFTSVGDLECLLDKCSAIEVMSAQGGEVTLLAGGREDTEPPVWSPDGRSIAFLSYPGGSCGDWCDGWSAPELHVMNADGSGRRKLLTDAGGPPNWSSDDRTLIIIAFDRPGGAPGVVAIPAIGGAARLLWSTYGAVSADGQWLAFTGPR